MNDLSPLLLQALIETKRAFSLLCFFCRDNCGSEYQHLVVIWR